jgi:AcrR family transcriptional regulator
MAGLIPLPRATRLGSSRREDELAQMRKGRDAAPPADLRILEMASHHVRQYGLARTTVSGIAEDVGMTHANIYRYFRSKAALIEAVTAAWLRPLERDLRAVADSPDPAHDKLERVLLAVHRVYRAKLESDRHLFDLFADAVGNGDLVARKHRQRVQSEIERIVEEGMATGAFGHAEPRRALALIFDAAYRFLHPVALRSDCDVPANDLAARFDRVLKIVLRSLAGGRA